MFESIWFQSFYLTKTIDNNNTDNSQLRETFNVEPTKSEWIYLFELLIRFSW